MKRVICSSILPDNIKESLLNHGFDPVEGGYSTIVSNETRFHPDMLYFKMPSGRILVTDKHNAVHNLDTFLNPTRSKTEQGANYPQDCVLNCFLTKKHLVCGSYVAEEILEECNKLSIGIIRVKQGYAACSTVKVTSEAFITADSGIYSALITNGYDALLVSNEGIKLNGYSNGFIGGCALAAEEKVYFTGNIKKHINYYEIQSFCKKHGKDTVSLCNDDLYDYGGFVLI